MQTTFTNAAGKIIAPARFAVYTLKNGNTFKKVQAEISMADFDDYEDLRRIELYENGTENLAPVQIDRLENA